MSRGAVTDRMYIDRSKAQRIQQRAKYQPVDMQTIGPSHEGEKSPVSGRASRAAPTSQD